MSRPNEGHSSYFNNSLSQNRKFPAANSKQAACKLSQAVLVMVERIWALRLTSFYSCQNFTADPRVLHVIQLQSQVYNIYNFYFHLF